MPDFSSDKPTGSSVKDLRKNLKELLDKAPYGPEGPVVMTSKETLATHDEWGALYQVALIICKLKHDPSQVPGRWFVDRYVMYYIQYAGNLGAFDGSGERICRGFNLDFAWAEFRTRYNDTRSAWKEKGDDLEYGLRILVVPDTADMRYSDEEAKRNMEILKIMEAEVVQPVILLCANEVLQTWWSGVVDKAKEKLEQAEQRERDAGEAAGQGTGGKDLENTFSLGVVETSTQEVWNDTKSNTLMPSMSPSESGVPEDDDTGLDRTATLSGTMSGTGATQCHGDAEPSSFTQTAIDDPASLAAATSHHPVNPSDSVERSGSIASSTLSATLVADDESIEGWTQIERL